jgi:hypothetical protein
MIRAISTVFICTLAVCSADPSVGGKPKPKPKPHHGGKGGNDDYVDVNATVSGNLTCAAAYVGQGCGAGAFNVNDKYLGNTTGYMCLQTTESEYRCINIDSVEACSEPTNTTVTVCEDSEDCEDESYCFDSGGWGSNCGAECDDCFISTCEGSVCPEPLSFQVMFGFDYPDRESWLAARGDSTDNTLMSGKMALAVGSGVALVAIVAIVALYTKRQEATAGVSKNGFTMVDQESQHHLPSPPVHREVQLEPVSLRKDRFDL